METALEQYLILAKTAKGKACEALILQAISNSKTFVFGELLDAIQGEGVSTEIYQLLEIFTYGTLADYRKQKLPDLTASQLKKLQMLTLVTLASEKPVLPYSELISVLEINSTRQLEDLIIDSIYEGLIKGKIDHKNSCLRVFECFGRDIFPSKIPEVLEKISKYVQSIEELELSISKNINYLQESKTKAQTKKEEFDKEFNDNKESVKVCINNPKESEGLFSKIKKQVGLGKPF
jgi:COP9 signalosome complex subunit 7